jgi:hypothetical protein
MPESLTRGMILALLLVTPFWLGVATLTLALRG